MAKYVIKNIGDGMYQVYRRWFILGDLYVRDTTGNSISECECKLNKALQKDYDVVKTIVIK